MEKTGDSTIQNFDTVAVSSNTSYSQSSASDITSDSGPTRNELVASILEDTEEIEIPRTPRNTAVPLTAAPLLAEDSLDDVVSNEESTISEEKPDLPEYSIPTSIDTEAIFATITDFSRKSVEKINQSFTSLRKRSSPTSSPKSLAKGASISILDCRRVESGNENQDKINYIIFMFTISLFFWGQFFEHVTNKIKSTRCALKQKAD